jgi:hypothetical protein
MALIWLYGNRQQSPGRLFNLAWLPVFLLVPLLFAYFEEGLWDGLIWAEHPSLFPTFSQLPLLENNDALVLVMPLLALPQITHYILDGFIWRRGHSSDDWRAALRLDPSVHRHAPIAVQSYSNHDRRSNV